MTPYAEDIKSEGSNLGWRRAERAAVLVRCSSCLAHAMRLLCALGSPARSHSASLGSCSPSPTPTEDALDEINRELARLSPELSAAFAQPRALTPVSESMNERAKSGDVAGNVAFGSE